MNGVATLAPLDYRAAFDLAPIGLVMRLFGHDPMERRIQRDAKSYWVDARPQRARDSYFKQF